MNRSGIVINYIGALAFFMLGCLALYVAAWMLTDESPSQGDDILGYLSMAGEFLLSIIGFLGSYRLIKNTIAHYEI